MHRLTLSWNPDGPHGQSELRLFVDDVDLVEILRSVELPDAEGEGHPSIAGGYAGLAASRLRGRLVEHYLGGPGSHMHCGPHEKTVLLSCACGEPGCWPLMARVEVTGADVRWLDFEQPHRDRSSYESLGPLVFDKDAYERVLADAETSARRLRRGRPANSQLRSWIYPPHCCRSSRRVSHKPGDVRRV